MDAEFQYNWDDLEVGRFDLDHSENFFERKHLKHEQFVNFEMESDLKENNKNSTNSNENFLNKLKQLKLEPEQQKTDPVANKQEECRKPKNLVSAPSKNLAPNKISNKPPGTGAPKVYKYSQIYEKKKEMLIKKKLAEEKQKRIFHSKPAPKFSADTEKKKPEPKPSAVTVPVTPQVLKKSIEAEQKRKLAIKEYVKRHQPQKFVSKDAHVVHEEPFKPKKIEHVVEPLPFNLHVEKRLKERKQYDDKFMKALEEKKKQEEEERRRREEKIVRNIRKAASFKARPNPFK